MRGLNDQNLVAKMYCLVNIFFHDLTLEFSKINKLIPLVRYYDSCYLWFALEMAMFDSFARDTRVNRVKKNLIMSH